MRGSPVHKQGRGPRTTPELSLNHGAGGVEGRQSFNISPVDSARYQVPRQAARVPLGNATTPRNLIGRCISVFHFGILVFCLFCNNFVLFSSIFDFRFQFYQIPVQGFRFFLTSMFLAIASASPQTTAHTAQPSGTTEDPPAQKLRAGGSMSESEDCVLL